LTDWKTLISLPSFSHRHLTSKVNASGHGNSSQSRYGKHLSFICVISTTALLGF